LKGEVRIEQLLEDDTVFESGRRVILSDAKGAKRDTEIESFRRQHGRCVAKFRGIDSISEAEKAVGSEIKILRGSLPVLEEGWFYTFELRGCSVYTANGEYLGIVTGVIDSGGTEVLQVDLENRETLVPFAQSYLRKIDLKERRIEVDLPEGLRELNK
jgi:16S rRNA processing protein RimM